MNWPIWNVVQIIVSLLLLIVESISDDSKILSTISEERRAWTYIGHLHWWWVSRSKLSRHLVHVWITIVSSLPAKHIWQICLLHDTIHDFVNKLVLVGNVNFILRIVSNSLHWCKSRILLFPWTLLSFWNWIRHLLGNLVWTYSMNWSSEIVSTILHLSKIDSVL